MQKNIIIISKENTNIPFKTEYIYMSEFLSKIYTYEYLTEKHDNNYSIEPIPLNLFTTNQLLKMMQFLELNYKKPKLKISMPVQNSVNFFFEIGINNMNFLEKNESSLFSLIKMADYLDIPLLLNMCCANIALKIKNLTIPEIREYLGLENNLTKEEEIMIKKENNWILNIL